jgi:hypothetical protein
MSVIIVEPLTPFPAVVSLPCDLQLRQTLSATEDSRVVSIEYLLDAGSDLYFDVAGGATKLVTHVATLGTGPTAILHTLRLRASGGGGPMDGVVRLRQRISLGDGGLVEDSVTLSVVGS